MKLRRTFFALLLTLCGSAAGAVGFQHVSVPDADGAPLEVGIWYPSDTAPASLAVGPVSQTVAVGGTVTGRALPLVVISHGSGGSYLSHVDTALKLAEAGFVVAAVTHRGDNYADMSRAVFALGRPRHMSRMLDYLLQAWPAHEQIDARRIGIFGFSAGGFTALVSIGGVPDLGKVEPFCRDHHDDFACSLIASQPAATLAALAADKTPATHDARIRAAVIAAPALGYTFAPAGLAAVSVPVQLWRGADDRVLPDANYTAPVLAALPRRPDYHVVPMAGHFDFLAPCSAALAALAPVICVSAPGFDRAAFHAQFDDAVVAFFKQTLQP